MQISDIKNKSKAFLAVNKYHPLVLYAVVLLILVNFIILALVIGNFLLVMLWYVIVLIVIFYFLMSAIAYSNADFYCRSYNLEFDEKFYLFEGFKKENFLRALALRAIRTGMVLLGLILLIFPGIFVLIRTSMSYFILKDNPKFSAWDAMKESDRLVKSKSMDFFKLAANFIGWFLLGIITFGLVFIYVGPYYKTAKSIFYNNVLLELDDNEVKDKENILKKKAVENETAKLEQEIKKLEMIKNNQAAQSQSQGRMSYGSINPQNFNAAQGPVQPQSKLQNNNQPTKNTAPKNAAPLYLDDLGNVGNIIPNVEEIVLPEMKAKKKTPNESVFVTSDVEIMEDESFEDFRKRVERLRRERDEQRELEKQEKLLEQQIDSNFVRSANIQPPASGAAKPAPKIKAITYDEEFSLPTKLNVELDESENEAESVKNETPVSDGKPSAKISQPQPSKPFQPEKEKPLEITKPTRAELIEKLRKDREKKNR